MGAIGFLWGVIGVSLLLGNAIYRLTLVSIKSFQYDFLWYHWLVLALNLLFMAHSEGYRGFQKRFSPMVAARARHLKHHPKWLHVLLAPIFCMGFFYASRKRKILSTSLTIGIICLVLLVRVLNQPWRGIIDMGVVVGLLWGVISMWVFSVKSFFASEFSYSPQLPE